MEDNKNLVPVEQGESGELDIRRPLEIAEARNKLFERVLDLALSATRPGDWINQDGKPRMGSSGAEKVARRFGMTIGEPTFERENQSDSKGPFYTFTCSGLIFFTERDSISSVGTGSSRDPFFARAYGQDRPDHEVDPNDIKKKAWSNWIVNGVTRVLGLRNLDWADLAKHGITPQNVSNVEHEKTPELAEKSQGSTNGKDPVAMRTEIWARLMANAANNPGGAGVQLEIMTAFKAKDGKDVPGVRDTTQLKGARLEIAYKKVMERFPAPERKGADDAEPTD